MTFSFARLRAAIAICFIATLCGVALAGPASASSAYPPAAPTSASACADGTSAGGAHLDSNGSCVAGVVANRGSSHTPSSGDGSPLAQTGFDAAAASIVVLALVGVGALCLVAGRRRRHS